jgi:putative ABC transport system permease protein
MSAIEILKIALNALRANKMRSFLTMLGIIIGVASVIVMVSISSGASSQIEKAVASLGTNILTVFPGADFRARREGAGSARPLSEADVKAIEQLPGVVAVSGSLGSSAQLIYGNVNWSTQVQGVHAAYFGIRDWDVSQGREFTSQEARSGAKVAVIGATTAKQLFGTSDPVGARIRVNRVPFTVIGVLQAKGQSGFGQDQDDTVLIPISTMRNRIRGNTDVTVPNNVGTLQVQVDSSDDLSPVSDEITDLLRERRHIQPGQDNDFMVGNRAEFIRTRTEALSTMSLLLAATGGVALVVGGIGIMNIMLVSVTERTREIGLRMAIGARRKVILSQFLGEATTLCILGGIIGIFLGAGISTIMALVGSWPITIDLWTVLTAIAASAFVGIFFGFYPARKASMLNPIEALRYE